MSLEQAMASSTLVVSTLPIRSVKDKETAQRKALQNTVLYDVEVDKVFKGDSIDRFTLAQRIDTCRDFPMEEGARLVLFLLPVSGVPNTFVNVSSVYRLEIVDDAVSIIGPAAGEMWAVQGISEAELLKRMEHAIRYPAGPTPTPRPKPPTPTPIPKTATSR